LDIGNVFAGFLARFFGVGVFERDDFRFVLDRGGHFLDLHLFVVRLVVVTAGLAARGRVLLEIGTRIGFAGIGGDDRIPVEIVEFLAGIGVFAFGAAVLIGQGRSSSCR